MYLFASILFLATSPLMAHANLESPSNCDRAAIDLCLSGFQAKHDSCGDDLRCQCMAVITSGANCYVSCPQDDMTNFIKTFGSGKCSSFDPYLSTGEQQPVKQESAKAKSSASSETTNSVKPSSNSVPDKADKAPASSEASKITKSPTSSTKPTATSGTATSEPSSAPSAKGSAQLKALTITPSDPTTTYSLTQGYNSHLEQSRIKENLKSIRLEQAKISSEAKGRLELPSKPSAVNRRESAIQSSKKVKSSKIVKSSFAGKTQLPSFLLFVSALFVISLY